METAVQDGDLYKPPAFQFYPDDFIADTVDLTAEELGVYMRLICHQWRQGGVPRDIARQANIGRVSTARMRVVFKALESKFELHPTDESLMLQSRLERVRQEAAQQHARRQQAGLLGGRPKNGLGAIAEAQQNLSNALSEVKQNESKSKTKPKAKKSSPISKDTDSVVVPNGTPTPSALAPADAAPSWFEPIRDEVRSLLDEQLLTLSHEQMVTLGRYSAFRWANYKTDEQKNLRQGVSWGSQIENIRSRKRFSTKPVREFIGAGDRVWKTGGKKPLRNVWDIGSALGEDAA